MTENVEITDASANVETPVSAELNTSSNPVVAEQAQNATPQTEKMIPQSQVNKIAAREAREAAEKAAARTREQMLREFEERQTQSNMATPQVTQGLGGMQNLSDEALEKRIMEAAHKMSLQAMGQKIATDYESKINSAKDEDPDFARAYDESGIGNHPHIVMWTNELENTADVVKEMVNNPEKFAQVMMLAGTGAHGMAKNALKRLSSSLKDNAEALKQPSVREPLSQIKPTNIGTADNGPSSVSDFAKQSWLRG